MDQTNIDPTTVIAEPGSVDNSQLKIEKTTGDVKRPAFFDTPVDEHSYPYWIIKPIKDQIPGRSRLKLGTIGYDFESYSPGPFSGETKAFGINYYFKHIPKEEDGDFVLPRSLRLETGINVRMVKPAKVIWPGVPHESKTKWLDLDEYERVDRQRLERLSPGRGLFGTLEANCLGLDYIGGMISVDSLYEARARFNLYKAYFCSPQVEVDDAAEQMMAYEELTPQYVTRAKGRVKQIPLMPMKRRPGSSHCLQFCLMFSQSLREIMVGAIDPGLEFSVPVLPKEDMGAISNYKGMLGQITLGDGRRFWDNVVRFSLNGSYCKMSCAFTSTYENSLAISFILFCYYWKPKFINMDSLLAVAFDALGVYVIGGNLVGEKGVRYLIANMNNSNVRIKGMTPFLKKVLTGIPWRAPPVDLRVRRTGGVMVTANCAGFFSRVEPDESTLAMGRQGLNRGAIGFKELRSDLENVFVQIGAFTVNCMGMRPAGKVSFPRMFGKTVARNLAVVASYCCEGGPSPWMAEDPVYPPYGVTEYQFNFEDMVGGMLTLIGRPGQVIGHGSVTLPMNVINGSSLMTVDVVDGYNAVVAAYTLCSEILVYENQDFWKTVDYVSKKLAPMAKMDGTITREVVIDCLRVSTSYNFIPPADFEPINRRLEISATTTGRQWYHEVSEFYYSERTHSWRTTEVIFPHVGGPYTTVGLSDFVLNAKSPRSIGHLARYLETATVERNFFGLLNNAKDLLVRVPYPIPLNIVLEDGKRSEEILSCPNSKWTPECSTDQYGNISALQKSLTVNVSLETPQNVYPDLSIGKNPMCKIKRGVDFIELSEYETLPPSSFTAVRTTGGRCIGVRVLWYNDVPVIVDPTFTLRYMLTNVLV